MTTSVGVSGTVTFGGGSCGGCGGGDATMRAIELLGAACAGAGLAYEAAIPADGVVVSTSGSIGQNWVDLPYVDPFTSVELLIIQSSARFRLRFDPTRPSLVGSVAVPGGGVTSGTATFTVTTSTGVQSVVAVTFSGATNTPALVLAAINAAMAAAGVQPPCDGMVARLSVSNVLSIFNPGIGPSAFVELAAGAPSVLGLGTALVRSTGTSRDTPDLEGLFIGQFPRFPNAPTQVQISGVATIDLVAAGRVSA